MAETARAAAAPDVPALDFERPVIELERKIEELVRVSGGAPELRPQIELLEARARELQQEIFADLSPWQKVQLSRHPARPYTQDYIDRLFPGFIELHGDRRFADDPAIRSEEHTSELQSLRHLVCRLLLEKKKKQKHLHHRSEQTKQVGYANHM